MPTPPTRAPEPPPSASRMRRELGVVRPRSRASTLAHDTSRPIARTAASREVSGTRPTLLAMPGQVLCDRYELRRVLGRGGMGVALEAHDRLLDRMVVVKILPRALVGDALAAARLVCEARLAARVTHPAIVAVLDLGLLDTGEPYLVMEHLAGHDLGKCLDAWGALSLADTLALLAPIADALDCLHAAGIVHRDVKPSNVLVLDGVPTRVKLIDFGLALLDDETFGRLTREGVVVGTAEYLAPELVRGARPTPAADVYAFATVAYEMLAGRLPFEGGAPLDILLAKSARRPDRLDVLGVASERVASVIERALSPSPADRPASAGELIRALAEPIPAPAPASRSIDLPVTLPMDETRLRGAAALAVLVCVVLLVLAALVFR